MPPSPDMIPVSGVPAERIADEPRHEHGDSGMSLAQQINARRAQYENPEGLRLARSH